MPADFGTQSEAYNGISGQIIGAISLFVPHPITSVNGPMEEEDERIAVDPIQLSLNGDSSTLTDIAKAFASDSRPRLMLIAGKNTKTSQSTVIGIYLPSALSEGVSLRLFFELQPKFRLHRWSSYHKGLTSMLVRDGSKDVKSLLSRESNANSPGDLESNEPFGIGGSEGEETCIKIDPVRKLASSVCHSTESQVEYSHFAVLGISGGEQAVLPGLMNTSTTWAKGIPGTFQGGPKTGVNQGNELKARIMGFGPV
ncbi:hypothetical protein N7509_011459 [Penicillium cosmopolitanum]|uniref:Uncharacterized protein n=1 Tax=Penicillium cosmopolitanum TaxID=1131564 RepID=A0A9W9VT98_9EURO|nr:uncharacterized protein N7509_011459 [Penicillium cosmopolitanum]KAJ5388918.1 hypothetical protein N7509_011459 [Penicillium cosmopolitanum]